jgi:hypothetical protein
MELSITFIEFALFVWAAIATTAAFKFKHDMHVAKVILMTMVTNEDARNKIVEAHQKLTKMMENTP